MHFIQEKQRYWVAACVVCLWMSLCQVVQGAVVFPGEFAPGGNWSAAPDRGSITMDSTSIVITGPTGTGSGVRSSLDVMNYIGPSNNGVTQQYKVTFHYKLEAGNSLNATALFITGGTPTALAGTTYGGGTVEGDFSAVIPQFGQFAFGLDNMIYKNVAAKLTITQFVVAVPEASTWWGSSLFVLAFGWRYWWVRRKGRAKVNPSVAST
ncbi:MAG: hypothetical protein WCO56_29610 [Verrucomicrobiota bacterium]